jgi:2-polyprenyl-3-methyl-5-hydroxy-6-metoxy-1,4-benzoquinol methylase
VGEDFEYRTSPDSFLAVRCPTCEVIYLDPRPSDAMIERLYPDSYHAFSFTDDEFGVVYRIRARLEARRVLAACRGVPDDARIIDVGCGDGFHLGLLREFGGDGWRLEGVDLDERAVNTARARGLEVHHGELAALGLDSGAYDVALLIQTIEHLTDPVSMLETIKRLLKPGGRVLVVTDNAASIDARLFRSRHWGGYHFPRHLHLFNEHALRFAATRAGLEVARLSTIVSPVNWTYSVRNLVQDIGAPRFVTNRFSLVSPGALAAFTVVDMLNVAIGKGALLRAELRVPR